MLAVILVVTAQANCGAVDDVWGNMGLTDEAVQYNNNYANTVFDKYTDYSNSKNEDVSNGQYPTNLTSGTDSEVSDPVEKEKRIISSGNTNRNILCRGSKLCCMASNTCTNRRK